MGTLYSHLSDSNRLLMESMLKENHSYRAVGRAIGMSASTVCREIQRSTKPGWTYMATLGQRASVRARRRAGKSRRKLGPDTTTPRWRNVLSGLRCGWSPQQIAGRLALMYPAPASVHIDAWAVSHETVYAAIYAMPRGELRTELVGLLRKCHRGRLPRARGQGRFTGLQDMTSIALRPPEVAARIVPGHWEGDLIKGAMNRSAVGTIVERLSRYVMFVKLDSASAIDVLNGFTRRLLTVPPGLRKTMTYDQGSEMALHQTLAKRLRIDIFFCDPHSPWQRGSNENTNGLIREYLPKGVDLSQFSHQQLSVFEQSLNHRPRKILGFRTPHEVFTALKLDDIAGVALQA